MKFLLFFHWSKIPFQIQTSHQTLLFTKMFKLKQSAFRATWKMMSNVTYMCSLTCLRETVWYFMKILMELIHSSILNNFHQFLKGQQEQYFRFGKRWPSSITSLLKNASFNHPFCHDCDDEWVLAILLLLLPVSEYFLSKLPWKVLHHASTS